MIKQHTALQIPAFLFGLLAAGILMISGCKAKQYPQTAELTYNSNPVAGVIAVTALGYGKNIKEANNDAFRTAFENILFQGVPGFEPLELPMVSQADGAESNRSFFDRFFEEGTYLRFISRQEEAVEIGKVEGSRNIIVSKSMNINYRALKKHLQQQGAVRKFGY